MDNMLECIECEDCDCIYNVLGLCFNIDTMMTNVVSGVVTCSGAIIEFNRHWDCET